MTGFTDERARLLYFPASSVFQVREESLASNFDDDGDGNVDGGEDDNVGDDGGW